MSRDIAMQLVVIGNGGIAVDASGRCFTEHHTASFLTELAAGGMRPTFIQPEVSMRANANLFDGELPPSAVRSLPVSKRRAMDFWGVWHAVMRASLVYIYFPGTLPLAVAQFCRIVRKPYAIYLRGERFSATGRDAQVLRGARFICCVAGMGDRARELNDRVVQVQPMLDIGSDDIYRRDLATRPPGPWNLLFVGRLETAKGIPELVEAAERLRERGFPFRLRLVGGGPLHEELFQRYGNEPGAPIRVVGVIADRKALYNEFETADIFVLPTHHEGFPRVLHEAMIKSAVIVTTFVGGIPGVMRAGMDCIEIPLRNAAAIAEAIERIAADPPKMQSLADNALETVLGALQRHPTHVDAVMRAIHG